MADSRQKAAFDLLCIAEAYIFLHEVKHVRFARNEGRKLSDPLEEERACDRFARKFLMDGIDAYVKETGEPVELVRAKRALGIAVAKVLILEVTPADRWDATDMHPSVGERVQLFLQNLQAPLTENFWISAASFLTAICRSRGRLPDENSIFICSGIGLAAGGNSLADRRSKTRHIRDQFAALIGARNSAPATL